jgi:hypothetical protein
MSRVNLSSLNDDILNTNRSNTDYYRIMSRYDTLTDKAKLKSLICSILGSINDDVLTSRLIYMSLWLLRTVSLKEPVLLLLKRMCFFSKNEWTTIPLVTDFIKLSEFITKTLYEKYPSPDVNNRYKLIVQTLNIIQNISARFSNKGVLVDNALITKEITDVFMLWKSASVIVVNNEQLFTDILRHEDLVLGANMALEIKLLELDAVISLYKNQSDVITSTSLAEAPSF